MCQKPSEVLRDIMVNIAIACLKYFLYLMLVFSDFSRQASEPRYLPWSTVLGYWVSILVRGIFVLCWAMTANHDSFFGIHGDFISLGTPRIGSGSIFFVSTFHFLKGILYWWLIYLVEWQEDVEYHLVMIGTQILHKSLDTLSLWYEQIGLDFIHRTDVWFYFYCFITIIIIITEYNQIPAVLGQFFFDQWDHVVPLSLTHVP